MLLQEFIINYIIKYLTINSIYSKMKETLYYVYNHSISNVWNLVKDINEISKALTQLKSGIKVKTDSNSFN